MQPAAEAEGVEAVPAALPVERQAALRGRVAPARPVPALAPAAHRPAASATGRTVPRAPIPVLEASTAAPAPAPPRARPMALPPAPAQWAQPAPQVRTQRARRPIARRSLVRRRAADLRN